MQIGRIAGRRGLTLIELLVVIAVSCSIMAFLLPAIQGARRAAQRAACAANLRQVGQGLLQFETVNNELPPYLVRMENAQHSWVIPLLPYIDQNSLASQYNLDHHWDDPDNQTAVQKQLNLLLCPSSEPGRYWHHDSQRYAAVDYSPLADVHDELLRSGFLDPWHGDPVGAMDPWKSRYINDITDGTINTILVAEDAGRPRIWKTGPRPTKELCETAWASPDSIDWLNGSQSDGTDVPGPCALNCNNNGQVYSFHPGGANVVFCDGHVSFINEKIDIRRMAAMLTRAGDDQP